MDDSSQLSSPYQQEHSKHFLLLSLYSRRWGKREELGLGYVCAALQAAGWKGGIEAIELGDDGDHRDLMERLRSERPLLLGIACSHAKTDLVALQHLLADAHKANVGIHTTAGGYFASFNGDKLLAACPDLDSVVVGEGEATTVQLLRRLGLGRKPGLCPGLRQRNVPFTSRPPVPDLDLLAHPYRAVPWLDDTSLRAVATSRGCLAHCTFCNVPAWTRKHGRGWRGRSAASVFEEVEQLVREYGTSRIWFVDSSFEDPTPGDGVVRMVELADRLIKANLPICYYVFMRAESLCRPDVVAVLPKLVESGLRRVFVGIEAGSSERLKRYAKSARAHHNVQALQTLRGHGLATRAGWIMFSPESTLEELRRDAKYLRQLGLLHSTVDLFTQLELYTGASEVLRLQRLGLSSGEVWDDSFAYSFADPKVEPLATAMRRALDARGHAWNGEALHTAELAIATITLSGSRAPTPLVQVANDARDHLLELSNVMAGLNEIFFDACLDLAEGSWSDGAFDDLLDRHIAKCHLPVASAAQALTSHLLTAARRLGYSCGL